MNTIYLIRHGEIVGRSKDHRFIGRMDLPLSDLGREQMRRLAGHPVLQGVDKVLTSPLLRCTESATILTAHLKCTATEVIPDLAEIDLGEWEGLTVDEVKNRFPGQYEARGGNLADFRPENGESFADLQSRCWPILERAAACACKDVAIVAHAGVNRVLLCKILDIPLGDLFRLQQEFGCCNIINRDGARYHVTYHNFLPEYSRSSPL